MYKKIDQNDISYLSTIIEEKYFFVNDNIPEDYSKDELGSLVSKPEVLMFVQSAEEISKIMKYANENKSESEVQIVNLYDNNIREITENPVVQLFGKYGGNFVYGKLATVKVDGNAVKMTDEVDTLLLLYVLFLVCNCSLLIYDHSYLDNGYNLRL